MNHFASIRFSQYMWALYSSCQSTSRASHSLSSVGFTKCFPLWSPLFPLSLSFPQMSWLYHWEREHQSASLYPISLDYCSPSELHRDTTDDTTFPQDSLFLIVQLQNATVLTVCLSSNLPNTPHIKISDEERERKRGRKLFPINK